MASIFPTDPHTGDRFTVGTTTYQWTGYAWIKVNVTTQLENLTVQNLTATNSIVITSSTNAISTVSGAFQVVGGVGIGKDLYLGGSLYFTNASGTINASQVFVSGTANSTSTTSGALVVAGGVGIGKDVFVGGAVNIGQTSTINNAEILTTTSLYKYVTPPVFVAGTGTTITTSTNNFTETVTIWSTSTLQTVTDQGNSTTNVVRVLNATSATSITSAALVVTGGIAAGGDLWLGGTIYSAGVAVITTTTLIEAFNAGTDIKIISTSSVLTSGTYIIISNTSTLQTVTTRGSTTDRQVFFTNTTESTSSSTGAVVISGGLGVAGRINSESVQIADVIMDSGQVLVNSTDTVVVDIYPSDQYRSAKYLIQIDDGNGPSASFETIEILLLIDNAQTVYATEYAVLSSNGELGEFAADVQNDNMVRLYFTAYQASDKIIKIFRTGMTV
jgi:hypothetical protein